MFKKLPNKIIIIVAVIMALVFSAPAVYADEGFDILSAYGKGNTLYTFLKGNGEQTSNYEASLIKLDGKLSEQKAIVKTINNSDNKVRYLFLIDCSTSMRKYKKSIANFLEAVMAENKTSAVYGISCFGGEFFEPSERNMPENEDDPKTVINSFNDKISFKEQNTDPFSAIDSAIDYLDKAADTENGEQINLVLITDGLLLFNGKPSYSTDKSIAHDVFKNKLGVSKEILIHTYCLNEWEGKDHELLTDNSGLDLTKSEADPKDAGTTLADYVNNIYCAAFTMKPLPQNDTFSVLIGFNAISGKNYFQSEAENIKLIKNNTENEYTETVSETAGKLQSSEEQSMPPTSVTSDTEESSAESTSNVSSYNNSKNAKTTLPEGKNLLPYIIAGVFGVVVILLAAILFIILKKYKTPSASPPGNAVFIRLDVISGNLKGRKNEFYLTDELLIGRSKNCDIVFRNKDVSPVNSRIYFSNGVIYIQDMNSQNGTLLGGMKIFTPNRLRSEDEVTIGNVKFKVRF